MIADSLDVAESNAETVLHAETRIYIYGAIMSNFTELYLIIFNLIAYRWSKTIDILFVTWRETAVEYS